MANAAASRRLAEAVGMGPTAGVAGDQAQFTGMLGVEPTTLSGVHNGRGRPASDRLRVYRNNVIVSLSDALRTAFETTVRLVGQDFFHNAAVAYAMANKPRSPVMFEYGDGFADFLAQLPGLAPYPFVPEVARIERARIDATHAADAAPIASDALTRLAPEVLPGLTLRPHPATRLVPCPEGGLGAWGENQHPKQSLAGHSALVTRAHYSVSVTALDEAAARFTEALLAGQALGEAAASAGEGLDLSAALALLIAVGAFGDMTPGVPKSS